jgi:polyhydroxybutyrate depolymerase
MIPSRLLGTLGLLALVFAACSPVEEPTPSKTFGSPPGVIGGERAAKVVVPKDYDPAKKYPLVVELHGFGASSLLNDAIFGLASQVDSKEFILVLPEGTLNKSGKQFWNADDYCCDFDGQGIDDVSYLSGLLTEAKEKMNIDTSRIAFVGHSNGGYMTYRLGCEVPHLFTRMVVLAGAVSIEEAACKSPAPLDLIHIHGTEDATVPYESSLDAPAEIDPDNIYVRSLGAEAAVARWAKINGCANALSKAGTADFVTDQDGEETQVLEHADCSSGKKTTLWRVNGGDHLFLDRTTAFQEAIAEFVTE